MATNPRDDLAACAVAVMDAGLLVSRFVRAELWRQKPAGLSLAQFRGLAYVNAYPDCAPSELADYLMLTRPAVTRLVDELVRRRLLGRRVDADDRRRQTLALTVAGRRMLDSHLPLARRPVADRLESFPMDERERVRAAMALVAPHFVSSRGGPEPA